MEYLHTATPHVAESTGWVGRFADACWPDAPARSIVNVASRQSLAVQADRHAPIVFSDPERFVRAGSPEQTPVYEKMLSTDEESANKTLGFVRDIARTADKSSAMVREAIRSYSTSISYGSESSVSTLSTDLKKVAALISAGFPTRVYYVGMGGFDTHSGQSGAQQNLLMYVADALEGFMKDVARLGREDDVSWMAFTEFGRRVAENQSGGTDHGTATPMYVLGKHVKGGLYSDYPSLSDLDENGDLKMTCDFRRVYSSLIGEWMGYGDTKTILKGEFAPLGIFA